MLSLHLNMGSLKEQVTDVITLLAGLCFQDPSYNLQECDKR